MWQLSEAIDGMGDACRALGIPVVGGNVSLYNESRGRDIDPTPVVGMLGIIDRLGDSRPPLGRRSSTADRIVVLGPPAGPRSTTTHTASVCALVASLVNDRLVDGVHDVSDGGLALSLAEMAVRSGVGFQRRGRPTCSPSRRRVSSCRCRVAELARGASSPRRRGRRRRRCWARPVATGSSIEGQIDVALDDAIAVWRDRIPDALGRRDDTRLTYDAVMPPSTTNSDPVLYALSSDAEVEREPRHLDGFGLAARPGRAA